MPPDHYVTLGVTPSADGAAIRAGYLRVMRASHPDRRPGDLGAARTAREANAAYAVLRDPVARAGYDRQRLAARRTASPDITPWSAQDARWTVYRMGAAVPGPPRVPPAYSVERHSYRRAVSTATARIAAAIFVGGLLILLALG